MPSQLLAPVLVLAPPALPNRLAAPAPAALRKQQQGSPHQWHASAPCRSSSRRLQSALARSELSAAPITRRSLALLVRKLTSRRGRWVQVRVQVRSFLCRVPLLPPLQLLVLGPVLVLVVAVGHRWVRRRPMPAMSRAASALDSPATCRASAAAVAAPPQQQLRRRNLAGPPRATRSWKLTATLTLTTRITTRAAMMMMTMMRTTAKGMVDGILAAAPAGEAAPIATAATAAATATMSRPMQTAAAAPTTARAARPQLAPAAQAPHPHPDRRPLRSSTGVVLVHRAD